MTPKEQRIAIAEACGWKHTANLESWFHSSWPESRGIVSFETIPDYLTDLNAMHEAEKALTYLPDYLFHLREVCGPFPDAECEWNDTWWSDVVRATAPQRAEAFLRTLNLWKD